MKEVYIVAAKRTPIGGFLGSLSELRATGLGALAIRAACSSAGISMSEVDSVYMGQVLSAGEGQSPARQAAIKAGIPSDKDATTVNKVCASGMKAVMLGAQQIAGGHEHLVVCGGMESMSRVPHYAHLRDTAKTGDMRLTDGLLLDGLTDAYEGFHMGAAAEACAKEFGLSREMQDEYALASYAKALAASKTGKFRAELVPVEIRQKKGNTVLSEDEDIFKLVPEKVSLLKPVFSENGSITAANASNLNDGAAALVLASAETVSKYNLQPLARIVAFADAACEPARYCTAPALAIPKALGRAGMKLNQVDIFEINEAYATVVLANSQLLGIDPTRINLYGGAVPMGHPNGASGARIITTLISALTQEGGSTGLASICNGGGGASAIVIEKT